jgi:hypothetical protein
MFFGLFPSREEAAKLKLGKLQGATEGAKESLGGGANLPIGQRPNFNDFALKDKRVSDPRSKAKPKVRENGVRMLSTGRFFEHARSLPPCSEPISSIPTVSDQSKSGIINPKDPKTW